MGRIQIEPGVELATLSTVRRRFGASGDCTEIRPQVVLAAQPVDFPKSVGKLSALLSEALRANPYCGDVIVFRSERVDRVKLLA